MKTFLSSLLIPFLIQSVLGTTRTSPPAGAIIVRAGTNSAGEFSTLAAAVASLPNDNSVQSIFIFPGVYTEQVDITRPGPLTVSLCRHSLPHLIDPISHRFLVTPPTQSAILIMK